MRRCRAAPADASGSLFALGTATPAYDGSEWQALRGGRRPPAASPRSTCPRCAGSATCSASSRRDRVLSSAHDVSDGGLAVALAEIALACGSGLEATIDPGEDAAATLFGECCGLVVVSCAPDDEARLAEACDAAEVPLEKIGSLGGAAIALRCGELALECRWRRRARPTRGALPRAMAAG